jgi:glutathione S-transferase
MIRLHGYPISNYYNRVKMALKIKGLAFEEVKAAPAKDEEYLKINPLGVIPTLEIEGVFFAETHPMLEYLEERFPDTTRLLPKKPEDRHLVRQLVNYIDIHIDKPIRFVRDYHTIDAATPEALKEIIVRELLLAVGSINRAARFAPYIAGNEISFADCAAYCTIPWFALLAERHLGENPLAAIKGFADYKAFLDQNPDFAELHKTAEKQIKVLERAKKFAGKVGL